MFRVKNHQGHLFRLKQSDTAKSEKKLHNKIAAAVDRTLIHIIQTFTFREGSAFVTSSESKPDRAFVIQIELGI